MLNKYIWKRPGSANWQLRVPVPKDVQAAYGRVIVTKTLGEQDELRAAAKALPILNALREEWAALRRGSPRQIAGSRDAVEEVAEVSEALKLQVASIFYNHVLQETQSARSEAYLADRPAYLANQTQRRAEYRDLAQRVRFGDVGNFAAPLERVLGRLGVNLDRTSLAFSNLKQDVAVASLDARAVSLELDEGQISPQPKSALMIRALANSAPAADHINVSFSDLVDLFMRQWLAGRSSTKETNTEQQKRATFRLFGDFFGDRTIRHVRHQDAANFFDELRLLNPAWARTPQNRMLSWKALLEQCGGQTRGLSDATMNRHMQVLQELWAWAAKRGHCEGDNPFDGFHKKLRAGQNVMPYVAWETDELNRLLMPPPKRQDLLEVMLVGMFTGMRLDEIASMTWERLRTQVESDKQVHYFQVEDAKTPAGNRKVPVHRELQWLLSRDRGATRDRIWPTFNEEGPSKKPGADAGREFSRFKTARGFTDRSKTFHSFRKNVTRIMERAGVPENDWAQIFGHERGFTYTVYNPDGIDMRRRAEIINLITYPGLTVPHPVS